VAANLGWIATLQHRGDKKHGFLNVGVGRAFTAIELTILTIVKFISFMKQTRFSGNMKKSEAKN